MGGWRSASMPTRLAVLDATSREVVAVAVFAAVQIADGVVTVAGVRRFGVAMESNPLLALSMATVGAGVTLSAAKALAVLLGTLLYRHHCHRTLAALTVFYLFAAVLPWTSALA